MNFLWNYIFYIWIIIKAYDDEDNSEIERDKIKPSSGKNFNIIDSGIDKPVIDFSREINMLSKKIISIAMPYDKTVNFNDEDNISIKFLFTLGFNEKLFIT